jgi:hypothetical protein
MINIKPSYFQMLLLDEQKILERSLRTKANMSFVQFIDFNKIDLDTIKVDKFFHNLNNNIPIYMNETMIEYFGYSGIMKKQKESIKNMIEENFIEYKDQLYHVYDNKDYNKYLENLESEYSDSKNPEKIVDINTIYPPVPTGRGTSTTKHTLIMPKLFKEMLMMCQTEKGKQVRRFYIDMLDVFNLYVKFQNNVEISELRQLLEDNKIMTHKIYNTLNETKDILIETKDTLDSTKGKLDRVLIQRVETDKLPDGDIPQVIILHDRDAVHNECDLYVLRCQTKQINSRIKKLRAKYGDNIRKIYTIKQPNAIAFWKIIKTKLGDELIKDSSSNWFRLSTISIKNFKDTLNVYEKERKTN